MSVPRAWRAALVVLAVLGCAREPLRGPPPASFLVVGGDSTFWAQVVRGSSTLRSAPFLLAELDGRLHELYVTNDDRSFYDGVFVGQRVYRRDLISGDSVMMFEDSTVARLAAAYAAAHPGERPLAEDQEASDDPSSLVTTETEIVDVVGPFATILRHVDIDLETGEEVHTTRQMVIDLRTGRVATLADLVPDSVLPRVVAEGRRGFAAVRDSIGRSTAAGGEVSPDLLPFFAFDSGSFAVVVSAGRPAIAFLAPGSGPEAGETALPIAPVEIPEGEWWRAVAPTLPAMSTDEADEWLSAGNPVVYQVVAQYDSLAEGAMVAVRDSVGELWPIGTVPLPVHRVHRLDYGAWDPRTPEALARAFEEAARYSREARTALAPATPGSRGVVTLPVRLSFHD